MNNNSCDLWEWYKDGIIKQSKDNVIPPHVLNKRNPKLEALRTKRTIIKNINKTPDSPIVHTIDGRIWIHTTEPLTLGDRAFINQINKQNLSCWPDLNQCINTKPLKHVSGKA